ncbi:MAG: MFS transporter [Holophagales bacterium]|jgi:dipeptide/tripeptide permease|nr:MFS transporter [Holophagales bacterium]
MTTDTHNKPAPFPSSFWSANTIELFERAAYYAMASFMVIYLGQLGFGSYWPSTISSSVLWGLVYFLPILSGTISDQIGFKRALLIAFVLVSTGYLAMGYPVWIGGNTLIENPGSEVTATLSSVIPVCLGVLFIGVGGSFVKPCIAGTVQKTAGVRRALGFAIFYMVINIGSLVGRFVSFNVRRTEGFNLSSIFLVSLIAAVMAFFLVAFLYKDPDAEMGITEKKPARSVGDILLGMIKVLMNLRFTTFIIITSGFYFIYNQVYNLLPLYTKKTIELTPAMDIYTAANPFVIVTCQLLITRIFGKLPPVKSIFIGMVIIGASMLINIFPLYMAGGVTGIVSNIIPLGSIFIILTVAIIAFGELFKSAKLYEYIASFAPKGQEGLFQGYSNLPMAIGSIIGGPAGAWIFNEIMCKNAVELPNKLLQLDPGQATLGWIILAACGFVSALCMFIYNWWIRKH